MTLLWLYIKSKQDRYLEDAKEAANWLIENMQYNGEHTSARGAFRYRYDLPAGPLKNTLYSFDTGICLEALVDLYKMSGEQRYLDSATSAARWLINEMQNGNGSFKAYYDFEKTLPDRRWSRMPGPHHAKLSFGLLKLYKITRHESLRESARALCEWVLRRQTSDGRFRALQDSDETYVHAHCYALEGIVYSYREFGYEKLKDAAIKGIEWLLKAQTATGGISRWHRSSTGFSSDESTDALAQTIRLWVILRRLWRKIPFDNIKRALYRLLDLQCINTTDDNGKYGFYYGIQDNAPIPHINSWATMFSIQALQMLLEWNANQLSIDEVLDHFI